MAQPTPEVRAELERYLQDDQTKVGQVHRLTERGLNPDQIANELGVATSGFVSNNRTKARALLEGHLPRGATMARQVAQYVRGVAAARGLSAETQEYLADLLDALGRVKEQLRTLQAPSSAQRLRLADEDAAAMDTPPAATLRELTEAALRARAESLVAQIQQETGVEADDYLRVATATSPLDELAALVNTHAAGRTFQALRSVGRLDLSLESHSIDWASDLPLRADVVEAARARLSYYGFEARRRAHD